jgi:CRISPR-associated endonuclease/helicase Cas3
LTYYAHTRGTDKADWQTVLQHLTGTAELARRLGADSGLAEFAATAAMLHDLGKYSPEFQRRLEGGPKVDHATAGAKEIERLLRERGQSMMGRLLAYCIAGHHGGLPDGGGPGDTEDDSTLAGRLKRPLKNYSAYAAEIDAAGLSAPQRFPASFRPIPGAAGFSVAFAARMIYSILVDADYLETETFCNDGKKPRGEYADIPALAKQFELYLSQFDHPNREIDRRRSATLRACIAHADLPTGLFKLTLPTGAGKTLTSMAFALQHAIRHGLKRIVYVIPYTSIIEQNAAVFKASLEGYEDHVLEHHSSFEWNPERAEDAAGTPDSALAKLKWAAENWDVPVVVTTNVQFFESLFASRNSRNRKVHNLAKSVIIFDEAQMLPREFMKPCIYSVVELVKNYGSSAVFCTATQPELERFLPKGVELRELIADPQAEFNFYRRVQVRQTGRLTDAELLERLNSHPQALCIVNTRKHAKALFDGLHGEGCFHLSTLMCAAHRRKVIAEIRQRLAEERPCRVVSTQLLEAGVDLDFPVGYRALAGLESIIQSAGRVNRENKQPTGDLFVFEPDSEHARHVPKYIQQTAAAAQVVLNEYANGDPVCTEAIRAYYNLLYRLSDPNAFDSRAILACFEKGDTPPTFNFATAAERFKLIENDTVPVIVPYDPQTVRRLVEELQTSDRPLQVIRRLQPFTVNIYQPEYEALVASGAIELYAETYAVLGEARGGYDEQTGLILADRRGGYGIFLDS